MGSQGAWKWWLFESRILRRWGDANESINEEALAEKLSQVPQDAICWSSMQREIDLESFSLWDGPTKDLGDNATAEDFFNQFIDVDYRFWLYFEKVEAW